MVSEGRMGRITGNRSGRLSLGFWIAFGLAGTVPLAGQTTQPATLRQAAALWGIPIGAAASDGEYGPGLDWLLNPTYASTLSTQYDMLEPGNAMKWDVTQPSLTTYNFVPGDTLVQFAQQNNMIVRGHNLCWHSQLPTWLQSYAGTATPAQMYTLLQNHIAAVAGHFKGKVFAWDVVNEAFSDSNPTTMGNSIWYNQPGIGLGSGNGSATDTAYIEQAFRWARQADPNALLFYNDYNIEGNYNGQSSNPKFNAVLAMVTDFVNRGVPIDGVGFQMHISPQWLPSMPSMAANMKALATLGLEVHITEMDVAVPVNSSGLASDSDLATQAQIYQNVLEVCLEQPNCTAFQVWGVSYNDSWLKGRTSAAGLPFDFNYQPTPAFTSLMNAWENAAHVMHQNYLVNSAAANPAGIHAAAVTPGELVTIYAAPVGPASPATGQVGANGQFPTSLGNVQVQFDSTPAPLLYAGPGQVNAIVPFEVAGQQQTTMQYTYSVPMTALMFQNSLTLPVASAAPAIFSQDQSGGGPGAILNQNYSLNSSTNPAAAGDEIQIFGTGGGAVTGGATDGGLWPAVLGSLVDQPVTATIGGVAATVDYAGPAPYLVNGALQVNVTVPAGLASGAQPVVITIGTAQTPPGITVAVK